MRIATWNVNSLRARLDKVVGWLGTAQPDILLLQETKLADAAAPDMPFAMAGYQLAHHGEGRWNGVGIASRVGVEAVVTNFGDGPLRPSVTEAPDDEPAAEARMIAAMCGGIRVISLYAPNGRALDTPFYAAKLAWFERLLVWLRASASPDEPLVLAGDLNVAPTDLDVYDPAVYVGTTHTSGPERAAFQALLDWGLVDAYRLRHPEGGRFSWWDYRAGNFHKGLGMRIDHMLVTRPLADRVRAAEIDRDARKGPTPSDHAPMWIDIAEA
ncbi:MAG TPA: exodeoxyribonuclease III [Candidatus Sulfotelmatobacter sp.]|nr:exodeoxyribonuclease III [Candidatus Sulfotelmatobacter sp.]